ncbi:MAG: hypothetical protein ABFD07_16340 [Methanobacterium sp.]
MVLSKTPTTMISNQTIIAGGSYTSPNSLDLSGAINLEVSFVGIFNAATNAGAKVEMFSDVTGSNSSFTVGSHDDPIDAMDVAVAAGFSKGKPAEFKCCSRYVKFKVTNLGTQSITGVYVYAIIQAQ